MPKGGSIGSYHHPPDYYLTPGSEGTLGAKAEDLLSEMGKKKSSPTLFRDEIIREIYSILISENKPNALLVGPAGCGKTNIVEELAKRIRRKNTNVPTMLYGYRVFSLSLSDIISGCSLVGQLENKVRRLVDYLEAPENKAILFLDEVHMLFDGESYKKVAQILKPALSRGRFMVIAATTTQEVKKIDEDPAFNRRFTRVLVDELSGEQTVKILRRTVKGMEKHYGVKIGCTNEAAERIVSIADEFCCVGSHRPDNAITLMDRAVATAVLSAGPVDAGSEIQLTDKLIRDTAYRMTSGNSTIKEFDTARFRKALVVIRGQDAVLDEVTRTIELYDLHLRPRKKPLTLLFAGPSGVGKTETARILAKEYIGEKPIVLNMSEYASPSSVSRILGTPSGYAGADSCRELPFDALETNPYQVILLDEFEKCDQTVQKLFMSVFDEGILKANNGKEIDFSKTVIVATTGAGSEHSRERIGFVRHDHGAELLADELTESFGRELVSRFSKIFAFNPLDREIYKAIIRDEIGRETALLESGRFGKTASDYLKKHLGNKEVEYLTESTYNPELGARPAQTAVREYLDSMMLNLSLRKQEKTLPARQNLLPLPNLNRESKY